MAIDRNMNGKFKEGNSGGPGGKRKLAGRPPKPKESLLRQLYDLLEKSAPLALNKLHEQINHPDPKIAQGACKAILAKTLPERSAHETWQIKQDDMKETIGVLREYLQSRLPKVIEENECSEKEPLKLTVLKRE